MTLQQKYRIFDREIHLIQGDITELQVDAIVNAANDRLAGGGGVDGAIHRAGGPAIMKECDQIRKDQGGCPTGKAVVTTAGNLKAKYIIHTVGPIWDETQSLRCDGQLKCCYTRSLIKACENSCTSIAYPSISTGVYGYPIERAAPIALETVAKSIADTTVQTTIFVSFSKSDYELYVSIANQMKNLIPIE